MVRLKIEDITKSPGTPPKDNFLSQVQGTINSFKDLVKMARELQGLGQAPPATSVPASEAVSPAGGGWQGLLKQFGDVPVAKIIEALGPYTPNQLVQIARKSEVVKNVGPEK